MIRVCFVADMKNGISSGPLSLFPENLQLDSVAALETEVFAVCTYLVTMDILRRGC